MRCPSLLLIALFASWSTLAPGLIGREAGKPSRGDPDEVVAGEVGARLDELVKSVGGWDGSALVAAGGTILLAKGYGTADPGTGAAARVGTLYDLGNLAKWTTTALYLRLVDDGVLKLDDLVALHVPAVAEAMPQTTVRQVLGEVAGLPTWFHDKAFPGDKLDDRDWAVKQLARVRPTVASGSLRVHSTPGWVLAAVLPELATGVSFRELMWQQVFAPLGMNDTGVCGDERLDATRAALRAYDPDPTGELRSCAVDITGWSNRGSSGVASTVFDLFRFRTLLSPGDLIAEGSQQEMWRSDGSQRGLGIDVPSGPKYTNLFGKGNGCCQYYTFVPEGDLAVIMLGRGDAKLDKLGNELMTRARDPASTAAVEALARSIASLAGEFAHPEHGRFGISREGGVPVIYPCEQASADRLLAGGKAPAKLDKRHTTQAAAAAELLAALAAGDAKATAKLMKLDERAPRVTMMQAMWGRVAASTAGQAEAICTVGQAGSDMTWIRLQGEGKQPALVVTWKTEKIPQSISVARALPLFVQRLSAADGGWWRAEAGGSEVFIHPGTAGSTPELLWWHEAGKKAAVAVACPRVGAEAVTAGDPPPLPESSKGKGK